MKAQVVEKNCFSKSIGLLFIFLMISITCSVQCLFSQTANANTIGKKFDFPEAEEEAEIQVEAWMVNNSCWNNEYITEFQTEESEPEISIEPWMLNFEEFEQALADDDPEIKIEEWMCNETYWFISANSCITQNEVREEEIKPE